MRFQCPLCHQVMEVDNSDMGSDLECGSCTKIVTVPTSRTAIGAVILDFILMKELGRGGMGVVYLAYQISLDRPAAIKVLASSYANNPEFITGFIKEARAAAKLNHPHIVQAYAVGEDQGIFYFAMEFVDGETMKEVLRRDKIIAVKEALSIIQQIAEALDYAWKEAKLIHRDIKPDNIMMTKNGRAKLADLGLARVAGEIEDAEGDEVMGTPQYISPEALTGAPMDGRSDIYSLGATFYHLVTGRFPFEGKSPTEIARKHLEAELVLPNVLNPEVPEEVAMIIAKMMEKNPKDRYQDAEELVEDLRTARKGKMPQGLLHQRTSTSGSGKIQLVVKSPPTTTIKTPREVEQTMLMPNKSGAKKNVKKKSGNGGLIAVVLIIIVVLIGVIAFLLFKSGEPKNPTTVQPSVATTAPVVPLAYKDVALPLYQELDKLLNGVAKTTISTNPQVTATYVKAREFLKKYPTVTNQSDYDLRDAIVKFTNLIEEIKFVSKSTYREKMEKEHRAALK